MTKETKSNQNQINSNQKKNKGEEIKTYIQWGLDILILGLLLFYMIHINWGIGMKKIEIKADCQTGQIIDIYGNITEQQKQQIQTEITNKLNEIKKGG